jgi:hypothetical protein
VSITLSCDCLVIAVVYAHDKDAREQRILLPLLAAAQLAVDNAKELNSLVVRGSVELVTAWSDRFRGIVFEIVEKLTTLRTDGHLAVRHKANHVDFTDGGFGVGIKYQSVRLMLVMWLLVTRGTTFTRYHNAPGDSKI